MRRRLTPILIVLAAAVLAQTAPRPAMSYEAGGNRNQPSIAVRQVRGVVKDREGIAVPHVGLGLFTGTPDHRLVEMVLSGPDGQFDFGQHISEGRYRLVAKYPGLCTVNIPIVLNRRASGKKILLDMRYPGLDVCSYAQLQ